MPRTWLKYSVKDRKYCAWKIPEQIRRDTCEKKLCWNTKFSRMCLAILDWFCSASQNVATNRFKQHDEILESLAQNAGKTKEKTGHWETKLGRMEFKTFSSVASLATSLALTFQMLLLSFFMRQVPILIFDATLCKAFLSCVQASASFLWMVRYLIKLATAN